MAGLADGGPRVRTQPWPARALFGEAEKAAAMALFRPLRSRRGAALRS